MSKKFIYVNGDGDYNEGGDAYEQSDFVNISAGVGDAGKPILLDAGGKLDGSFIDLTDIDHDQLTNYVANEHIDWTVDANPNDIHDNNIPNALLIDGSRSATVVLSYDSAKTFSNDAEIVDKKYVDDAVAATGTAAEWQDSCIDAIATPPGVPTAGDRYLVVATATGAWVGKEDDIAEWNGTAWIFTTPTTGTFTSLDDDNENLYYYNGSAWVIRSIQALTASLGVEIVGNNIQLDLLAAGGLKLNGNEVGIEPNDFAGEGLVDDGSDNLAIDWSTAFNDSKAVKASDLVSINNGYGASIIGIEDAGDYTSETNVEGALQEIYAELNNGLNGVEYTVGAGGVSIGDAVYISGNNTVSVYSNISSPEIVIGIAAATVAAGGTVKVLANDTILSNILTGATAGTKYFWTGSGWTSNFGSFSSGNYIWVGGVANNTTNVHIQTEFIMKKA